MYKVLQYIKKSEIEYDVQDEDEQSNICRNYFCTHRHIILGCQLKRWPLNVFFFVKQTDNSNEHITPMSLSQEMLRTFRFNNNALKRRYCHVSSGRSNRLAPY
ncbi:hypothetical protein QTP88_020173 [Uroleucon formosanum]